MQGNVVTAAKWLGASLVLASIILVGGLHRALSTHSARLTELMRHHPEKPAAASPARVEDLLAGSEKLRLVGDEFERFWFLDQPSRLTPFRTQGGLGP